MTIAKLPRFLGVEQQHLGEWISFRSVGLPVVLEDLRSPKFKKPRVVDFAPINKDLFELFRDLEWVYYSSNRLICSLVETGANKELRSQDDTFSEAKHQFVRSLNGTQFDDAIGAIFVWDFFNYLDRFDIIELMAYLSPLCKQGTLLSAFIWLANEIPSVPGSFRLKQIDTVEYRLKTHEISSARPIPTAQSLISMMPSFKPVRLLASDSGVMEVLFEFDELAEPPNPNIIPSGQLSSNYW